MPRRASPATKMVVFQCPGGMPSRKRSPRGPQPCRRAMLVEARVASMKTRRSGSRSIWPSNQARRAPLQNIRAILFAGVAGLFLRVIACRWKKRWMVPKPKPWPCPAKAPRICSMLVSAVSLSKDRINALQASAPGKRPQLPRPFYHSETTTRIASNRATGSAWRFLQRAPIGPELVGALFTLF